MPRAVFGYLSEKYQRIIEKLLEQQDKIFKKTKHEDDVLKKKHLKLFRPNLENPANKTLTMELNTHEVARTEKYKEFIDDIQMKMLDVEQDHSLEFYNAYLNNLRGLIKIFDVLLYKEDFI